MFINIGAQSYKLKYDYNSLCEIESLIGVSIQNISVSNFGLSAVRAFLKAGLREYDITLDEAGDLIQQYGNIPKLNSILIAALKESGVFTEHKGPHNAEKKTYMKK